jgi:hypothetical protein
MEELKPKTAKSNLNVEKHKKRQAKARKITNSRRANEEQKLIDADIIFGIDNGATGTLSCIASFEKEVIDIEFRKTFSNVELDYQKEINYISRIDWKELKSWFDNVLKKLKKIYNTKYSKKFEDLKIAVVLERPMINCDRFKQSKNAARSFEATLIVLEMLNLNNNYLIIDSKKWQHYFFGVNENSDLKKLSKDEGITYLNTFKTKKYKKYIDTISGHGDADSLLISRWAFEKFVKTRKTESNGK